MRAAGATGWVRWALPIVLVAALAAFFALGLDHYVSFGALVANREALLRAVAGHRVVAAAAFTGAYALATALSIPGGAVLTIAGGFLFGALTGAMFVVLGATIGASMLFLIAKTSVGGALRSRAGGFVDRLAAGFRRNALAYLLFLRLVPLFPFWLVNLVPALLGVSLRIFIIGTFFGIIPGTLVYASVGAGLGALLEQGRAPDLGIVFRPRILLPLLGLGLLALTPALIGRMRAFRGRSGANARD